MPPTTRAKRRLAYKRLLDKRDKLRKEEQRLCEQQSKLVPAVETHKTELNTVTAQHEHDISRLESIKTFFESRYGQYDELVRLQQENAEDVNQVQGVHALLLPVGPDNAASSETVEQDIIDQNGGETDAPPTDDQTTHDHHDENDDEHGMNLDDDDIDDENDQEDVDNFSDDESDDSDYVPFANMAKRRRLR
ncbi:hypothetical protein GRF29_28g1905762 [Pseudopithomyces chartarum]|uniref:Uncharacterized protein n=1 Tax=Pseudopithomyces chartarum TaxID=1892770 RepID=A0AAN6M0B3_9PLEO|nr:hypothetical protein GRF29_28g1905762 [Pseudopithomyces chartarum]